LNFLHRVDALVLIRVHTPGEVAELHWHLIAIKSIRV